MSVLAVIVATPVAVWAIDRLCCRGEFTLLVLEAVNERSRRPRSAKRSR